MNKITGTIAGYDSGGNEKNGFALLKIEDSTPVNITTSTLANAEAVINELQANDIIGLGVDTLSCWCTGRSGWRPADLWLRKRYPLVRNSIMPPGALTCSMGINGMSVLMEVAQSSSSIVLSETHPKVLFYALTGKKYNYIECSDEMNDFLSSVLFIPDIKTNNDHEWDAAISAYTLLMGITGSWENDLHKIPLADNCRLIQPCGATFYYWPDA